MLFLAVPGERDQADVGECGVATQSDCDVEAAQLMSSKTRWRQATGVEEWGVLIQSYVKGDLDLLG